MTETKEKTLPAVDWSKVPQGAKVRDDRHGTVGEFIGVYGGDSVAMTDDCAGLRLYKTDQSSMDRDVSQYIGRTCALPEFGECTLLDAQHQLAALQQPAAQSEAVEHGAADRRRLADMVRNQKELGDPMPRGDDAMQRACAAAVSGVARLPILPPRGRQRARVQGVTIRCDNEVPE